MDPSATDRQRDWERLTVELCLAQPGATLEHPFGAEADVYKVGGKIFAIAFFGESGGRLNLKVEPERGADLRGQYPAITPGYHMNKRHWITAELGAGQGDGEQISPSLLKELVEDSYDLVRDGLPRRCKDALPATDAV